MFEWHDKQYLGAAHGISAILQGRILTQTCITESPNATIFPPFDTIASNMLKLANLLQSLIQFVKVFLFHFASKNKAITINFKCHTQMIRKPALVDTTCACSYFQIIFERPLFIK